MRFTKTSTVHWFETTGVNFQNPNLSRRLNRLIGSFGQTVFNAKLEEYSTLRGGVIDRNNPAYTSQKCSRCGYVDKNNRKTQDQFQCTSCGLKMQADVCGGMSVGQTLYFLARRFEKNLPNLISRGIVGRSKTEGLLRRNSRFCVQTAEESGVAFAAGSRKGVSKLRSEKWCGATCQKEFNHIIRIPKKM